MKTKYFEALFRIQLVHGEHAFKVLVTKKIPIKPFGFKIWITALR